MNSKVARSDIPGQVELQLLRPGPPHNQLLSPLTEYLALCGDHPNTTLRIPLEHEALLTRLRALQYGDSEATRMDQLRETARIASELLASVPGLIADLASDRGGGKPLVHLSIASRASELALFPFELALAPIGFPGTGQPLCLQPQLPVCLTRRSRNVRNDDFRWDQPLKILLVASDAGGEIPLQQHHALLRKLVEPWVATMAGDQPERTQRKLHQVLQLVTPASLDDLRKKIESEAFTHIHILAHGCIVPRADKDESAGCGQPRFGIAFHDRQHTPGGIDVVDGRRLAEALQHSAAGRLNCRPAVVTLATCESAAQGGVVVEGASVAFDLHDAGIPLVVASQFPLTFDGSILMTESLYRGFLDGEDPRRTLWETRRRLHSGLQEAMNVQSGTTYQTAHDWASMTVYAAFPDDLDRVLPAHHRDRRRTRMNVHLRNVDQLLDDLTKPREKKSNDSWWDNFKNGLETASHEVMAFSKWVDGLGRGTRHDHVMSKGIAASAQKRIGLLYLQADDSRTAPDEQGRAREESVWRKAGTTFLSRSREAYWQIFEFSRSASWALVQYLALDYALRGTCEDDLWIVADRITRFEQHSCNASRRAWALTALVELIFLKLVQLNKSDSNALHQEALELTQQLRQLFPRERWDVYSAYRQFQRYKQDFVPMAQKHAPRDHASVDQTIEAVLHVLEDLDFREFTGDH